jgi:hypothetical protein
MASHNTHFLSLIPTLLCFQPTLPLSLLEMAYNISRVNTPPMNAATKDISNTLPCTAAPVPPPDLAVEDDDGLSVDEGDL